MNFHESVLEENNIEVFEKSEYESLNSNINTKSIKTNKTSLKTTNTMSLMSTNSLRN
jgi:hypothetical protein